MKLGLLWYDADRRVSPQARLAEAATRFAERFGRPANCCHVNPEDLFADPIISVVADPSILKHHFWVGRDEALEPERRRRTRKAAASSPPEPSGASITEAPSPADYAPASDAVGAPEPAEPSAEALVPSVLDAPAATSSRRRRRSAARGAVSEVAAVADGDATGAERATVAATDELRQGAESLPSTPIDARKPRRRRGAADTPAVRVAVEAPPVFGRRAPRRAGAVEAAPPAPVVGRAGRSKAGRSPESVPAAPTPPARSSRRVQGAKEPAPKRGSAPTPPAVSGPSADPKRAKGRRAEKATPAVQAATEPSVRPVKPARHARGAASNVSPARPPGAPRVRRSKGGAAEVAKPPASAARPTRPSERPATSPVAFSRAGRVCRASGGEAPIRRCQRCGSREARRQDRRRGHAVQSSSEYEAGPREHADDKGRGARDGRSERPSGTGGSGS
jgi:hypothetical protein